MERRLSAILAVDVVGYSRLMERDEANTFERLRAHRKELFEPEIAAHHGRVFKLTGDGLLAEFASVVDAVECAVMLQRAMAERNGGLADGQRIDVRMGINLGDVIVEDDDRHGEGVVVAARLQQLAEPGGIAVSGTVADHVKHKLPLRFEAHGQEQLKNIVEPVAIYRVRTDGIAVRPAAVWLSGRRIAWRIAGALAAVLLIGLAVWYLYLRPPLPLGGPPAVAVLPFDNLSGDPDLDYFGDGVTEDIITMLSRSPELQVIARNSSFQYRGGDVDVKRVGRELGVQYVVEGSVRKDADKVRIVAQLIDARSGAHVWADRFDDTNSDPWILQDDVAAKIVSSLGGDNGEVRRAEYRDAWGKDTASLEEYDYYLRGHEFLMRFTREGTLRAGEIWREGLARFPNSSLLRVKLGSFHVFRAWNLWSDDPEADYREGGELIRQGLSIPGVSPKAQQIGHWMLAFERASVRDFDHARAEAQMAIQLAPFDATMLNDLASVQIMSGHPEVALDWAAKAAARDPGNPGWTNHTLGWAYLAQGEHEKAVAALEEGPQFGGTQLLLAIAYARLNRPDDAKAAVQKALTLDPLLTQASWRGGSFYSDPGLVDKEVADLARAGLPEK